MARKSQNTDTIETATTTLRVTPRLKQKYKTDVVPKLQEEFKYKSSMQTPKLEKIVINMGTGSSEKDPKHLENSVRDMTLISGQKPVVTTAKKAIANFKLREGMKVGVKVTLRGDRMYHFFDKLATVVLPRIRDFQGLSPKSFDGRGNYACGISDQSIFPEIEIDQIKRTIGFDLIFVTSAPTDSEGRELLMELGLPFRDMKKANETAGTAA